MTVDEIVQRFVGSGKDITPERVRKLRKLCERSAVSFESVLALLTEGQRQAVQGA